MGNKHRTPSLLLMVAACGLAAVPLLADDVEDAREAEQLADQHVARGDYRSARIEMMNAIGEAPDLPDLRIKQAGILLRTNDALGAQLELERALELGADLSEIRPFMGDALAQQGRWEDAERWLTEGPVVTDAQDYTRQVLARIYRHIGEFDAARTLLDEVLARNERDPDIWVEIARFRFAASDRAGAAQAAAFAVEIAPNNIEAITLNAEMVRGQYGMVAALPWFERALQIDDSHVPTLTEYAATLGEAGRFKDMLAACRKIINLEPENSRAFYMQAVIAARAGHYELTRSLLHKMGDDAKSLAGALLLTAIAELKSRNWTSAIKALEVLIDRQPGNLRARQLLALALYRSGQFDDALQPVQGIAGTYAHGIIGQSHEARDDYAMAEPALQMAYSGLFRGWQAVASVSEGQGQSENVRQALARGNLRAARALAQAAQRSFPGSPDAHILVGDIAVLRQDWPAALAAYDRAMAIAFREDIVMRIDEVLAQQNRDADRQALLLRYIAANPTSISVRHMLGNAYFDNGRWALAAETLNEVRKRLGNNNPLLLADLALAQLRSEDHKRALRTVRTAYRIAPMSAVVSSAYGEILLAKDGAHHDAVDLLKKAVALRSDAPGDYYLLAQAHVKADEKDAAIAALREALALGPFSQRDAAEAMLEAMLSELQP